VGRRRGAGLNIDLYRRVVEDSPDALIFADAQVAFGIVKDDAGTVLGAVATARPVGIKSPE
jgi:hypothetical protein